MDISAEYGQLVNGDSYALYLNKSECKYCYTNGEEDLVQYKHEWYNDNPDIYSSQYLIDKMGDLKNFAAGEKNIVCYPVLDTLEYIKDEFERISVELMTDVEEQAEEYGYIDIESPYLNKEMQSIYQYLESEINLRKSELQNILDNIRQQARQAKETYDRLDNTFAATLASYDTGDGTPIGKIETNIFGYCENPGGCSHEKWIKSKYSYEDFYKKSKYKPEDVEQLTTGILI